MVVKLDILNDESCDCTDRSPSRKMIPDHLSLLYLDNSEVHDHVEKM